MVAFFDLGLRWIFYYLNTKRCIIPWETRVWRLDLSSVPAPLAGSSGWWRTRRGWSSGWRRMRRGWSYGWCRTRRGWSYGWWRTRPGCSSGLLRMRRGWFSGWRRRTFRGCSLQWWRTRRGWPSQPPSSLLRAMSPLHPQLRVSERHWELPLQGSSHRCPWRRRLESNWPPSAVLLRH